MWGAGERKVDEGRGLTPHYQWHIHDFNPGGGGGLLKEHGGRVPHKVVVGL